MRSAPAVVGTALAAAVRAPSVRHVQPWLFEVDGDSVRLLLNRAALTPGDEDDAAAARLACGAALCNLRVALRGQDRVGFVHLLPDSADADLLALIRLAGERPASSTELRLADAIGQLHVGRHPLQDRSVTADARGALSSAAHTEGARMLFVDTAERYQRVAGLLSAAGQGEVPQRLVDRQATLAAVLTPGVGDRYDLLAGAGLQRALLAGCALGLSATMVPLPFVGQDAREELRATFTGYGHARALVWLGYPRPAITQPRLPADEATSQLG